MTDLLSDIEAPSDAELISRVRGGDVAAYGELFARHVEAAKRLARQLVRGHDTDDLVSDAFAKVLQQLQAGGGPDVAFRAYLLTSVRRLHVDRMRASARLTPSDDMERYDDGVPFQDTAISSFDNGAAAKAFASLPERWQLVLWHLEVEGQKPADIAPLLGMSANSVSALAYRAREGLRQAFLTMHLSDTSGEQCRWVTEHLGGYVRNGLSRRDTTKVEEHLEECRRCTAMYLELTEVNSNLAGIIAPLVLGAAAAAYLSAASGAAGSTVGAMTLMGRVRDLVAANSTAATASAVAAGVAAVATAGVIVANPAQQRDIVVGADAPFSIVQSPGADEPAGIGAAPRERTSPGNPVTPSESPADATSDLAPDSTGEEVPNELPGETPAEIPAEVPGEVPVDVGGELPTDMPGEQPGGNPGGNPGASPVNPGPTGQPTSEPTTQPTGEPTGGPTTEPTAEPSGTTDPGPTGQPTGQPTVAPSKSPTTQPSATQPAPTQPTQSTPTQTPTQTNPGPSNPGPSNPGPSPTSTAPPPVGAKGTLTLDGLAVVNAELVVDVSASPELPPEVTVALEGAADVRFAAVDAQCRVETPVSAVCSTAPPPLLARATPAVLTGVPFTAVLPLDLSGLTSEQTVSVAVSADGFESPGTAQPVTVLPLPSETPVPTVTPTITPSDPPVPTVTPSITPTITPSITPTITPTPTVTVIPTPTITVTPTPVSDVTVTGVTPLWQNDRYLLKIELTGNPGDDGDVQLRVSGAGVKFATGLLPGAISCAPGDDGAKEATCPRLGKNGGTVYAWVKGDQGTSVTLSASSDDDWTDAYRFDLP